MLFHDLKDIVMVYSSNENGKPDYSFDKAEISVWNPTEQREMNLTFTGSERPNSEHPGKIHFNVSYKNNEDTNILNTAFDNSLKKIFPNISSETLEEYQKVYLQELLNLRK